MKKLFMMVALSLLMVACNKEEGEQLTGWDKIIAEVKCNIPVNDNSYGAAQEYSIIKDINGLLSGEGKNKVDISECDLNLYYKFMVVLRTDKTKEAMQKIIKKINKTNNPSVIEYTKEQCFDKSKVYIVYIDYTK